MSAYLRFLSTLGSLLLLTGWAQGADRPSNGRHVYVFGDSYSDLGNLTGEAWGLNPPPWDPDRFTNGKIWVDFVARAYHTTIAPSFKGGTDYAVGGATIDPALTFLPHSSGIEQVQAYLDHVGGMPAASDIHIVYIGVNDLGNLILGGASPQEAAAAASANLEIMLHMLADRNVNHLWVAALPDIGDAPFWSLFGLDDLAGVYRQASAAFNAEVPRIVSELQVCDAQVIPLDRVHERIMAHRRLFGFMNVTDACLLPDGSYCSTPDKYYWFQASHPSERAHFVWSAEFIHAEPEYFRDCARIE
jgi:outer membrane lipase/esterase